MCKSHCAADVIHRRFWVSSANQAAEIQPTLELKAVVDTILANQNGPSARVEHANNLRQDTHRRGRKLGGSNWIHGLSFNIRSQRLGATRQYRLELESMALWFENSLTLLSPT